MTDGKLGEVVLGAQNRVRSESAVSFTLARHRLFNYVIMKHDRDFLEIALVNSCEHATNQI